MLESHGLDCAILDMTFCLLMKIQYKFSTKLCSVQHLPKSLKIVALTYS